MNLEVKTMLENMYEIIANKNNDPTKSWDRLIEFLAADNSPSHYFQFKHNLEWLMKDEPLATNLMNIYDPKLLKSDFYDHLGELYQDRVASKVYTKNSEIVLTPKQIADSIAQITGKTDKPIKILDPAVGSGRLLMSAYKAAPNSYLFGVDLDMRKLRIAMTNFAIHDIPGYFLNADSSKHEIDISKESGKANWKYMNSWYSCMDKLKPVENSYNHRLNYQLQNNLVRK